MEKAREVPPVGVRMPPDMRAWLKNQAAVNRRSLNSEVLMILDEVRRTRQDAAGHHAR